MRGRASSSVLYAQLSLALFLALCISLQPGMVLKWNEAGLSNYGVHIKTAVPYSLAFSVCALLTFVAARRLEGTSTPRLRLRVLLVTYGILNLLALASTYGYTLNAPPKHWHMVVGISLMLFEPLGALWLFPHVEGRTAARWWLGAELAGLVLGVIDFAAILHILFLAQLVTGVSFGVLLVSATRRVEVQ